MPCKGITKMSIYYFNITYRCNSRCMFCAADIPINSSCHEMQIEDFRNELDKENVGENDRVIVNGGEPTLHKDFFLFLDELHDPVFPLANYPLYIHFAMTKKGKTS